MKNRRGGKSPGEGSEPCITDPSKCNSGEYVGPSQFNPENVKAVAYGADALYTTFHGDLREDIVEALEALKAEAQQDGVPAEFAGLELLGETVLVHRSGGVKGYKYHMQNARCDAFLVGSGKNQPEVWLQPSAELLHEVGPRKAVDLQRESVARLFKSTPLERANRLDLHMDLIGVPFSALGLGFENGEMVLSGATSRGRDIQTHMTNGHMNAFTVGTRGASVYLRVYDKTLELRQNGHLAALAEGEITHYLPLLWREHGWKGQIGIDSQDRPQFQQVLRVEFELGREGLSQFLTRTGRNDGFLDSWDRGLEQLESIWRYCMLKWFVVREAGLATQKTRWPVAKWWDKLADLPIGDGPQVIGARVCQQSSSIRKLMQQAAGVTVSIAALRGLGRQEALEALKSLAEDGLALKDFDEKKRLKSQAWRARVPVKWIEEQAIRQRQLKSGR